MSRGLDNLTRGQIKFARILARETKLNSRVIAAWMLAEQSGGAAKGYEAKGYNNWLNIGAFDSGFGDIYHDPTWSSPEKAAKATAQFLKGQKFGASSGIRKIIRTAGKDPQAQINAIAGSGWASSGYNGGASLRGTYRIVGAPGAAGGSSSESSRSAQAKTSAAPTGPDTGPLKLAAVQALFKTGDPLAFTQAIRSIDEAGAAPVGGGTPSPTQPAAPSPIRSDGTVKVAGGANRSGVDMSPGILKIVRRIAAQNKRTLTVGTGTNHNQMTTSGNVSDHWGGNAADIPAAGKQLTRLGQDALIAAGMDPAQARKQSGGVFNLKYGKHRRTQILFNTNTGGNHYNHLHVGVTALRGR